jgi:hypothetical protein
MAGRFAAREKRRIKVVLMMAAISALGISGMALAQTGQPIPSPIGAHVLVNTPTSMATPQTMPGGLYRLVNGYLNCPDAVPMTNDPVWLP